MLLDLAEHSNGEFVALRDIAERQGISKKYLEQIVSVLNKSDILCTSRGYQGGYRLAVPPESLRIGDILRLSEGSLAPVFCAEGAEECRRCEKCTVHPLWKGLYRVIGEYLDSVTLSDLIVRDVEEEKRSEKDECKR